MQELLLEEGVALASLTTLAVGGPARYLTRCGDAEALSRALHWAQARQLPTFVLGGGSNLLVADRGFDGLVICWIGQSLAFETCGEQVRVRANAGLSWDDLVRQTVAEGLAGVECLSGIPGQVGAAPIQNIGAYGQEVAQTIETVRVIDLGTGAARRIAGSDCGFGYRTSHFKRSWRGRFVVTGVDFLLPRSSRGSVLYPDLKKVFASPGQTAVPSTRDVRAAVLRIRRSKSMVLDLQDPNRRSAGSFFTNPLVSPVVAGIIREQKPGRMPAFPTDDGRVKLSAAWLIEAAGFRRGDQLGRAGLSTRHVLALVNRGRATAAEIVRLAARVRRSVRQAFGVTLQPEPVFLGFDRDVETLLDEAV
ncbi:MAG: UDP-N-acetylmuramate dehydrogenase [Acidobacteriota bacterium]